MREGSDHYFSVYLWAVTPVALGLVNALVWAVRRYGLRPPTRQLERRPGRRGESERGGSDRGVIGARASDNSGGGGGGGVFGGLLGLLRGTPEELTLQHTYDDAHTPSKPTEETNLPPNAETLYCGLRPTFL